MTPPLSGFYKLNVDAVSLIEGGKWGIGVVTCGAVAASCCKCFSYAKWFEICKIHVSYF